MHKTFFVLTKISNISKKQKPGLSCTYNLNFEKKLSVPELWSKDWSFRYESNLLLVRVPSMATIWENKFVVVRCKFAKLKFWQSRLLSNNTFLFVVHPWLAKEKKIRVSKWQKPKIDKKEAWKVSNCFLKSLQLSQKNRN